MSMVDVYYFECYDIQVDKMIRSKRPATRETVARCHGLVIEDSRQQVEVSSLDKNGFLGRKMDINVG